MELKHFVILYVLHLTNNYLLSHYHQSSLSAAFLSLCEYEVSGRNQVLSKYHISQPLVT